MQTIDPDKAAHYLSQHCVQNQQFSYLGDSVCSILSSAGKFCPAHGLRQLTQNAKSDVNCLQMTLTCRKKGKLGAGCHRM